MHRSGSQAHTIPCVRPSRGTAAAAAAALGQPTTGWEGNRPVMECSAKDKFREAVLQLKKVAFRTVSMSLNDPSLLLEPVDATDPPLRPPTKQTKHIVFSTYFPFKKECSPLCVSSHSNHRVPCQFQTPLDV
jgi:hypothetical protein